MNKKNLFLCTFLFLIIFVAVSFAMGSERNIIVHHTKTTIVDDEYAVRYSAMIKVVGLNKKDFEFIAKDAFESRRQSIRKYKLELESDGCRPEYRLRMVEARSMDDINDALDEIDNYKTGQSSNKILKNTAVIEKEIEEVPCYYDIDIERANEFEEKLFELTESNNVVIQSRQRPYPIKSDTGKKKLVFVFTLSGSIQDIELVLNELDRIFDDPDEDRD